MLETMFSQAEFESSGDDNHNDADDDAAAMLSCPVILVRSHLLAFEFLLFFLPFVIEFWKSNI